MNTNQTPPPEVLGSPSGSPSSDADFIAQAKRWCEEIANLSDGEIVCKLADILAERYAAIDALRKWDAVCQAAEECNAEMHSEDYNQTRWEAFEKKHGDLMEIADHARISVLSNLPENAGVLRQPGETSTNTTDGQ